MSCSRRKSLSCVRCLTDEGCGIGSACALQALLELLALLPADWPAAVAVALHLGPRSVLVPVLQARSLLPVQWAVSGTTLQHRHVYAAPAGHHLIVNPDASVTVSAAPRIRWFRPSADWLLHSGAASFGHRHVAIVLSGRMSDGALMLRQVKQHGGTVLAQDPRTSGFPEMPRAAIATGCVDAVLPTRDMPGVMAQLFSTRTLRSDLASWEDPFGDPASLAS